MRCVFEVFDMVEQFANEGVSALPACGVGYEGANCCKVFHRSRTELERVTRAHLSGRIQELRAGFRKGGAGGWI